MTAKSPSELPVLYGAPYSVYVRIVRLVLLEKGIDHKLEPIDIFGEDADRKNYERINPFGKIPSFSHAGNTIIETSAIARYINDSFNGADLMPTDALSRARANQIIAIIDNYAYPSLVWGIYVPLIERGEHPADEEALERAKGEAKRIIDTLEQIRLDGHRFFLGETVCLADLYAVPVFHCFLQTGIGANMLAQHHSLQEWWNAISRRPGYKEILEPDQA